MVRSSKSMYTYFHRSAAVIEIRKTASKTHQEGRLSQGDTDDRRRIAKGYLAETDKPTYEEVVMVPLATTTEGHDGRKTKAQIRRSEGHPCVLGKLEPNEQSTPRTEEDICRQCITPRSTPLSKLPWMRFPWYTS